MPKYFIFLAWVGGFAFPFVVSATTTRHFLDQPAPLFKKYATGLKRLEQANYNDAQVVERLPAFVRDADPYKRFARLIFK